MMKRSTWFLAFLAGASVCAGSLRAADAQLTVDLSRPGPAISPYLYGQFIEHLGRCIHDGIWAEKLRDRKFLLPPGTNSPWNVVRSEGAAFDVFHDTAGAYAFPAACATRFLAGRFAVVFTGFGRACRG